MSQENANLRKRWMVVLVLSILTLSMACSLPSIRKPPATPEYSQEPAQQPTLTPQPTPTQRPLPPALVESQPALGSELPLESLITLYFNQPMDRVSVESALKVRAFLVSNLIWTDDQTITIDPGQELPPSTSIGIEVDTGARSKDGLALTQPINLTFQTVGYLQLSQALPEPGASDVNPTSAIVAAFNHPVVPLGLDPETLPPAFTLEPVASGRGEWLNTSTYIFYPQPALAGGQTYTVKLDSALHGIDGNPLQMPEAWSFSTALPRLVSSEPGADVRYVSLDTPIVLTFNQPMDASSLQENFRLRDPFGQRVAGTFEWSEAGEQVTFKPNGLLSRSTDYTIELSGQTQGRGGAPLGADQSIRFQTVPPLSLISTQPAPGGSLENYDSVILTFSSPLAVFEAGNDLASFIQFEPRVPNLNVYSSNIDRTAYIYGSFAPSTNYRLSVSPELADTWGSKLGGDSNTPYILEFRSAPLPPGVFLGTGSDVHFLTSQDTSLSGQVRGISSLSLEQGSVPLSDFIRMMGRDSYEYRRTYRPQDLQYWRQALNTNPDQNERFDLYLTPGQEALPAGLYWMRLNYPEVLPYELPGLIVVSDVHLTFKSSATDVLVWAVDLRSNLPLGELPITVYDSGGEILASGRTDAEGVFQAPFPPRTDTYSTLTAVSGEPGQPSFGLALSNWNNEIGPWLYGVNTDSSGPRHQTYLYTDRPIYRPGQVVYFRGVVRQAHNGRYKIPAAIKSLKLSLYDGSGQEIGQQNLPLSPYGTLQGEFSLPANLTPGYYSISIGEDAPGWISFQVAEYRKPEFNLQVSFPETQVLAGTPLQATVDARYFFDAPVSNLTMNWILYANPSEFDLPGYQVGLQGASQWNRWVNRPLFGSSVAQGQATTLPDGTASWEIKPEMLQNATGTSKLETQSYTLEVSAVDESSLPVAGRTSIQVNPAEYYIGLRSDSWVGLPEQPVGFDVLTVGWGRDPLGLKDLRAEYSKVSWVRDESQPMDPYFGYTYKPEFELIASTDFQTGADGKARLEFTPPEPGTYQLSVFSRPADGQNAARSEILLWVGGPGQFIWPSSAEQRITLASDRDGYQPGDTAQVFVPNPLPGVAQALVTVERGEVLRKQVLALQPGGNTLSFPLTSDDAPNVYVAVTLLGQDEAGTPAIRQGFVNLPVDPQDLALNIQLTRQPEVAEPGDTLQVEMNVSDSQGKPVQGEFSLAVVDEAVLALADPNSMDILSAFYGVQPLGVQTAAPLTAYAQRKIEMPQANGLGGGGGGDGVPPLVRERFPDTAFWQAQVVTDADGKALLNIPLPDSLTTWQIETRGVTADTRVGQAVSEVVTTKDLIIRPVTPRFLVAGDHLELAAIVQNNSNKALAGKVDLQPRGFVLDDPTTAIQPFTIPPGERMRVSWWGTVEYPGEKLNQAELVFRAVTQDGSLQDAARPVMGSLPILSYVAPQAFRTAGTVDEAGEQLELVSLPRFYTPDQAGLNGGSLQVELSPSLGAAMVKALEVLKNVDCLCSELTISRLLPNLEMYRALQQLGLQSPAVEAQLKRSLDENLQTILSRQNFDGGWGWWPGDESDPYLTSYALYGLTRARGAGVLTNVQPIQRAVEYLQTNLVMQPLPSSTSELDRLAFAQFALAIAEAGNLQNMNALYDQREQLNPWSRALLALGLERTSPGSSEARTLISDLGASAVRTAAGAHWELSEPNGANMVSTLTNSAIVAYALAQSDPQAPILADAVRYLVANRTADGWWSSSYTTAWTLMALTEVMKATGEMDSNYRFQAALNDAPIASGQASGPEQLTPVKASIGLDQLYPTAPNLLAIQRSVGSGRLYYSAILNVNRPAEEAPALSKGLRIERRYLPAVFEAVPEAVSEAVSEAVFESDCVEENCSTQSAIQSAVYEAVFKAKAGEKVRVHLTLTVPRDTYFVMVEDFIPAGSEILNTNLKTSQLGEGDQPEVQLQYDPADPFARGWGWWYFRDPQIFDDHIRWATDYLPAGTYELTYTLVPLQAGEYQVLPAHAWELYFPEVQGTSSGSKFIVEQ